MCEGTEGDEEGYVARGLRKHKLYMYFTEDQQLLLQACIKMGRASYRQTNRPSIHRTKEWTGNNTHLKTMIKWPFELIGFARSR